MLSNRLLGLSTFGPGIATVSGPRMRLSNKTLSISDMVKIVEEIHRDQIEFLMLESIKADEEAINILLDGIPSSFKALEIIKTQLSSKNLEQLKQRTSLSLLKLEENGILTFPGSMLNQNEAIKFLVLQSNQIGSEGCRQLTKYINTSGIGVLALIDAKLTAEGAKEICSVLKNNLLISELLLDLNPLGDDGVSAVADLLKHTRSLRILSLTRVGATTRGATALAQGLAANNTLTYFAFFGHSFEDEAASQFARALCKTNSLLQELDLSLNGFTDKGVLSLSTFLKAEYSPHLTRFSFSGNRFNLQTALQLAKLASKHPKLQQVGIEPTILDNIHDPIYLKSGAELILDEFINRVDHSVPIFVAMWTGTLATVAPILIWDKVCYDKFGDVFYIIVVYMSSSLLERYFRREEDS
jgi:hypothetical protein